MIILIGFAGAALGAVLLAWFATVQAKNARLRRAALIAKHGHIPDWIYGIETRETYDYVREEGYRRCRGCGEKEVRYRWKRSAYGNKPIDPLNWIPPRPDLVPESADK